MEAQFGFGSEMVEGTVQVSVIALVIVQFTSICVLESQSPILEAHIIFLKIFKNSIGITKPGLLGSCP